MPIRLDEVTMERLRIRAAIERRSVNDLVREALRPFLDVLRIPTDESRTYASGYLAEHGAVFKALGDG